MKKPEKHVLLFLILLCGVVLFFIFYLQGELQGLEELLLRKSHSNKGEVKQEAQEPLPYTQKLRIALTQGEAGIYWKEIQVTADTALLVTKGQETLELKQGQIYTYPGDQMVRLEAKDGGKCYLLGKNKELGYTGIMELAASDAGMTVVNEIDLEEYLKYVVPSEMPRTYGQEALKAQAVCARTYAYSHSNGYAYPEICAHMDDTVSFQVYHQSPETEETNQAIADTRGQVLKKDGTLVETLYYSTSCGYSQDGTLFGMDGAKEVYPCKYQGTEEKNMSFEAYIQQSDPMAWESQERYFRWTAKVKGASSGELCQKIASYLEKEQVVVCSEKMKRRIQENKLGTWKGLEVTKRNPGGAAMEVTFSFAQGKVCICGQQYIREVLGSMCQQVVLQNQEVIAGGGLLPSSAFVVDKDGEDAYILYGGGFGHGVGMSQNGAKALHALGYSYKDILAYYYQGVELSALEGK